MKIKFLIVAAAVVTVLTACGGKSDSIKSTTPTDTNSDVIENGNSEDSESREPAVDFNAGLFINFSEYEDQVDDVSLLTAFEANLISLVEHNEELYRTGFVDEQLTENMEYYISNEFHYQFNSIESIEQNLPHGNVHITVIGKRLDTSNSTIEDVKMMYAFRLNDQRKWVIHTID